MSNDNETTTEAETTADDFSGASSSDSNYNSLLTNVTVTATTKCLTSATAVADGVPTCGAYSIGNYNAISVHETAQVPTTFAKVLGFNTWNLSATALASAKGGYNSPYNVAIIQDTTSSMNTADTDDNCPSGSTRLSCALSGIQVLLATLSPCPAGVASCGSSSSSATVYGVEGTGTEPYTTTYSQGSESPENATKPVDKVSLYVFPGLASTSDASQDYTGDCTVPSSDIVPYNEGPMYQIVNFASDYRTSDADPADCSPTASSWPACALNTSSDLVIAAGAGSCSKGVVAVGGEGTFYAGVIDTAQAQLVKDARANTQNVMILLSDGEAGNGTMGSSTKTAYSATNQCNQAITSAQTAAKAGTWVYAVAYGAETSPCSDSETTPIKNLTPCQTMTNIASSPGNYPDSTKFFSDYTQSGSGIDTGCVGRNGTDTSLKDIFKTISDDLTVSRLLPPGTT